MNLKKYKSLLQQEQKSLQALIKDSGENSKPVELDQTMVGRLSRMDAMQQQEMALETKRRRTQRLQMIEAALARINSGEFGYCVSCGEDISEKRLTLNPAIPICVDCARG